MAVLMRRRLRVLLVLAALVGAPALAAAQGTVAQLSAISSSGTLQSAAVATGNGTAFSVDGYATLVLTVNCSACSGGTTVNFELSADGTNFSAQRATLVGTTTVSTSTTTAGVTVWALPVAGFKSARARISSYSAGTITVTATAVPVAGVQTVVEVGNVPHVVVDTAPTTAMTAASLPLPTGAATSALQTTGNSSLSSIDGKTPALGQALAAASVPVVLPSAMVTALTPPAAITGFSTSTKQSDGTAKTQLVDGSGNVIGSSGNALNVNISGGGSAVVTEGATETAGVASTASVSSYTKAFDGTTFSRVRGRAGLIGSSDFGFVTRPFAWSDGTNTAPTMDAVARPGFQKITDGTNTMPTGDVAARAIFTQQGSSTPFLANALTNTVVTVVGSAARLESYYCSNPNTSAAYVQVFDISGSVTLGTSTPKWSIRLPPNDGTANLSQMGLGFANAIKIAATTTATGSTAPSTAVDCNFGSR